MSAKVLEIFNENPGLRSRGFLPPRDPRISISAYSGCKGLDEIGRNLPSLLMDPHFRDYAKTLSFSVWESKPTRSALPSLRLAYIRLGFLASGYVHQLGQETAKVIPRNIAVPLVRVCRYLARPPILSYDGYALYNWKRFRKDEPIALGNIDTIQNFVHLYDEHWFILVHVEIEAIAARILNVIWHVSQPQKGSKEDYKSLVDSALVIMSEAVGSMTHVLRRIPDHMDPALYYRTFRPYIKPFDNIVYEGCFDNKPQSFRGETGAQSSILPTLVAFMKIPHASSILTDHLADMRKYMPHEHRTLIETAERLPDIRRIADKEKYNALLDAIAEFRSVHYGWAVSYIRERTNDPCGTGGTPYREWLKQLIDETLAHKK